MFLIKYITNLKVISKTYSGTPQHGWKPYMYIHRYIYIHTLSIYLSIYLYTLSIYICTYIYWQENCKSLLSPFNMTLQNQKISPGPISVDIEKVEKKSWTSIPSTAREKKSKIGFPQVNKKGNGCKEVIFLLVFQQSRPVWTSL